MGQLQPLRRTAYTRAEFVPAIDAAWRRQFAVSRATSISPVLPACLFAQYAFETGWGKSCFNGCLGNERAIIAPPSHEFYWPYDYIELKTADEYINGKRVIVGGYFRAFGGDPSLDGFYEAALREGANDHVEFLSVLPVYQPAIEVLQTAAFADIKDLARIVSDFDDALKHGGYFTGPLDVYKAGSVQIATSIVHQIPIEETTLMPWKPMDWFMDAQSALDTIFGDEWRLQDKAHLATVLSCRYDCEGMQSSV